jgi:hypothetical protein
MRWSDLHGDMKNQAETTWSPTVWVVTEINGPKVNITLALVKLNHMRESPQKRIGTRRPSGRQSKADRQGDNPQGRLEMNQNISENPQRLDVRGWS